MTAAAHYDYRARMLACEHCGAPLEVPDGGGRIACGYCEAMHDVEARRPAGVHDAAAGEMTDAERLARLREQRLAHLVPPSPVRRLLHGGKLPEARVPEALALYRQCRSALQDRPDETSEKILFSLALVFSNHYVARQDHARVRAMLESSLERLREPRHRQVLYGQLARLAAQRGERDAAEGWASRLDAGATDLLSDTTHRLTHAMLATYDGRFARALELLGERIGEVPIANPYVTLCALLRAHALEETRGVEAATDELVRASTFRIGDWIRMARLRRVHARAGLNLCPSSFDRAAARVPLTRRSWVTVPLVVTAIFLAILLPLGWDAFRQLTGGRAILGLAGPVLFGILAVLGLPPIVRLFRAWAPSESEDAAP
jgi:hypothetical protein